VARFCGACGRSLDAFGHDMPKDDGGVKTKRISVIGDNIRGRHRVGFRRQKQYVCRVRLIARSPSTGKVLPTANPQRIKELQTAYVQRDRLQPGGDLHYAS
jgi:hypothetical protein